MTEPTVEIKNLGHLGIISSIFSEFKLIDKIDKLLPKSSNHKTVSHGEIVFAMLMQGLGFSSQRLYLSSEFLSHIDLKKLFGKHVEAEHFNSAALGRTLDAIYSYGATRFFTDLCLGTILQHKVLRKFLYIDTTSMSVTGRKYKDNGDVKLTHGHSKDYRMDLKQLVFLLVATEDGIPIFAETHSGNAADSNIFQETILKLQEVIGNDLKDKFLVLDSSLYSKAFLKNKEITGHWITRVPESVKSCKELLSKKREKWVKIDNNYKYFEIYADYGDRDQRWVVVENREAKYKELATLEKNLQKSSDLIEARGKRIKNRLFEKLEEAKLEISNQRKQHPLFEINHQIAIVYKRIKGSSRRIRVGYRIVSKFKKNEERITQLKNRKGKFVLATDTLDKKMMSALDIVACYRDRNRGIEGCFKFLKRKDLGLNQIFLKKESRIESMMIVMTLILFINNLAQRKLREYLTEEGVTVPNQSGRPTSKPTFKWVSYLMRHISVSLVKVGNKISEQMVGLTEAHKTIARAFGSRALQIYGIP